MKMNKLKMNNLSNYYLCKYFYKHLKIMKLININYLIKQLYLIFIVVSITKHHFNKYFLSINK